MATASELELIFGNVFLEYHARQDDPEGIPNTRGCVSLT